MAHFNGIDRIYHLLKFVGLAINPNWSRARKRAQFCFGLFVYFSILVLLASDLCALPKLVRDKNYELLFAGIGEMQAEICSLLNVLLFVVHAGKIRWLNNALKETTKFALKYSPQESASIFPKNWKHSRQCLDLELWYFWSLLMVWISAPVYDFVISYPEIDYQNTRLIYTNADYSLNKKTYYWHITALHLISSIIIPTANAFGFALAPLTCTLIRGQVAILMGSLSRVRELQRYRKKKVRFADLNGTYLNILEDGRINFKDCIKHHQMILRVLRKTKEFLAHFLFLNISCSAVCLINTTVAVIAAREGNIIMLYLGSAMMLLFQMFFITWHVTILKGMCTEVAFAAFSASRRQPNARREMSLIICRSNREEKFSCVLTNSLTFSGVFKILGLLWNYFTLCRQRINKAS